MLEIVVSGEMSSHFALRGRLDTNTSQQLEQHIARLHDDDLGDVQVDMSECEFVSSAGLRAVMALHKKVCSAGGRLVFQKVTPEVRTIFEVIGFDKVLTFGE